MMMSHIETLLKVVTLGAAISFALPLYAQETCPKTAEAQNMELASAARKIEAFAAELAGRHPRKYLDEIDRDEVVKSFWPGAEKNKLSGVQIIACGDSASSALIACDGKTIITTAHAVYKNGKPKWDKESSEQIKDCFLLVEDKDGKKYAFDFDLSKTKVGATTPSRTGAAARDWAVLKLQDPIPSSMVSPLKIAHFQTSEELVKKPMVFAAGYFLDMGVDRRAYTACAPTKILNDLGHPLLESPCSNNSGASGGGMITAINDQPAINALHVGRSPSNGNSLAVPMAGEFKKTLLDMADSKDCTLAAPKEGSQHASL